MATLTIAYDHSRDPMSPGDLGDKISTALGLGSVPSVDITPTSVVVAHPSITAANTAAIQTVISGYTLTPGYTGSPGTPQGNYGTLIQRANTALTNNQTYLGIASPTTAQAVAQVAALTRQVNGLIRFTLNNFSSIADS